MTANLTSSICLATAWRPRGELNRFERSLPELAQVYNHLVITLPPDAPEQDVAALQRLAQASPVPLWPVVTPRWPVGRHLSLEKALETGAEWVHYTDFDRLLRWVEVRPAEWRSTVAALQDADYLVVGRTPVAYATHPQALVQTEAISNRVVSHFLGLSGADVLDVSAGSKGFRRPVVAFILAHATPDQPFGADAEWPILAQRGGFQVQYCQVDGLDWESADRYQGQAVAAEQQRLAADAYDADPQSWAYRVYVADEIIRSALAAINCNL